MEALVNKRYLSFCDFIFLDFSQAKARKTKEAGKAKEKQ